MQLCMMRGAKKLILFEKRSSMCHVDSFYPSVTRWSWLGTSSRANYWLQCTLRYPDIFTVDLNKWPAKWLTMYFVINCRIAKVTFKALFFSFLYSCIPDLFSTKTLDCTDWLSKMEWEHFFCHSQWWYSGLISVKRQIS